MTKVIVIRRPTDKQIHLVKALLLMAYQEAVSRGADAEKIGALLNDGLAGRPVPDSTANMIRAAMTLADVMAVLLPG